MINPFKKVINFFDEVFSLFQEEESVPEYEIPEKWVKHKGDYISKPQPTLPQKGKIKIPYIRSMKKYMAGILLIINLFVGLTSLAFNPILSLIFLGSAFVILDYLWKFYKKPKDKSPTTKRKWFQFRRKK